MKTGAISAPNVMKTAVTPAPHSHQERPRLLTTVKSAVGPRSQQLRVITRTPEGFVEEPLLHVRFVPMTGEAQGR
jgi:hypothetical protein